MKLPVIVFIHGESYDWNAGNPYDGSILASLGNVVVVTINYRLGILGFLPATEGSARGNYGLMDQVAALHWVQENIAEFGGDPKNATIIGQGHGAAFVNLLMISPMARGLFQRAIMQSGSALSPWAIAHDALNYGRQVCSTLRCPTEESAAMLDCMRQRPLADIMRVQLMVPEHLSAFGPTVDGIVIPVDPLTPMNEKESLFGQYDLLFGVTRAEYFYHLSSNEEKHGIDPDRRDRLLRTLVRNLFNYHMQEIFLTIVNEYTDWTRPVQHPVSILDATLEALGDGLTVAPIIKAGNLHSKTRSKTYFYVFGYQTENGDFPQRFGCVHGEELAYLFGAPLVGTLSHFSKNYTKSEMSLSEAVMSYWINFAKSGDPNITPHQELESLASDKARGRFEKFVWAQYETVHQKYLLIGLKPKAKDHYRAHRLSFWLNLIPQLHRPGTVSVIPQHHLLDDHNNPLTYDGVVRPLADGDDMSATFSGPFLGGQPQSSPTLRPTLAKNVTSEPPLTSTDSPKVPKPYPGTTVDTISNFTETRSVMIPQSGYSTALSVTIAVGCSLLILNILIFAGVYYQRDKSRMEMKLQKRNYKEGNVYGTDGDEPADEESFHQTHGGSDKDINIDRDKYNIWEFEVRRSGEREAMVIPSPPTKTTPSGAASPMTICPPGLPPDYAHHHHAMHHPSQQGVRMLPPKVPPKPVMVPTPASENALPEAQPLLPHCGIQKQNPAPPPQTQEMPV
ncbi:neuroligin-2-like [Uloborus diversus]|uniref:neuroligin-2-like n=1 Tax=Uloborus diversus TaxID=327109 RepID=UPI0024095CE3|nr:neuroligin-2-like [Uloborus diversus]